MRFFNKYSDEDIILAIKQGRDEKPLSFLYKEVLPKVKSHILKNQGSEEEAKDIFQDAVIRFYNHVKEDKFQGKCSVSSFIFGIARNLWINRMKIRNRTTSDLEYDHVADEVNLMEGIITQEKVDAVNKLLSQIGEGCEKLLKLSMYENLSMKEIVERMGYSSEDVAKTYNYRCKQKLLQLANKSTSILELFGK